MKIQTNVVFEYLDDSKSRIVSMRGGTRSGKTYNILIWWIKKLLEEKGKTLTVARQTLPALRASAQRDFFEILNNLNLYSVKNHNRTRHEYILNDNLVEFIGVQQADRVRGRKRDYLFLNEANECDLESWRQLTFRTTDQIVIDYNPSDAYSWIYDDVETRDDCNLYVTTYRDNPFLEKSLVQEIERLQDADPDYWKVYGLGERAALTKLIYNHWKKCNSIPERGEKRYGLDFGYNVPTALLEVSLYENILYWRELIYQTKLTTNDLIELMKEFPELIGQKILADSAEPKTIEDLNRAGFWVEPAYKDIQDGIKVVKSYPLRLDKDSPNLIKEAKGYSWKSDKNGNILDEPIKFNDHLMDGGRYATYDLVEVIDAGGYESGGSYESYYGS